MPSSVSGVPNCCWLPTTNTASFDIPINDVSQNLEFNGFPLYASTLYASPTASGLGIDFVDIPVPASQTAPVRFSFLEVAAPIPQDTTYQVQVLPAT